MKRNDFLQPLSREHHQSLLLSWKIRTGLNKNVGTARIKKYADWFFKEHIQPHFKIEEKYIFPVLGDTHELVKRALAEHRRLTRLFEEKDGSDKTLGLIEQALESHIRFEERVLFNKIQDVATPKQLALIAKHHAETKFQENTEDEFWR